MSDQGTGAEGALKDEYTFYLAYAHIVKVINSTNCKMWLPDYSNTAKIEKWMDGQLVFEAIERELITVDLNAMLDQVSEDDLVQLAPSSVSNIPLTELYGDLPLAEMQGQVAIEERLWSEIPYNARPLPYKHRDQDYRVKVILQISWGSVSGGFMGFHGEIGAKDQEEPIWLVRFYSWTDDLLGEAWVNLEDEETFDQTHSTLMQAPDGQGSIFVALDKMAHGALKFLVGPKVPFGAAGSYRAIDDHEGLRPQTASPGSARASSIGCGAGRDTWLAEARSRIPVHTSLRTRTDVGQFISANLRQRQTGAIELISHSIYNILRLGDFDLTRDNLASLGICRPSENANWLLYLAGCHTGIGDEARNILRYFETQLKIKAYGTRRIVGLFDLDSQGIRSSRRSKLFVDANNHIQPKDSIDRSEILEARGRPMRPHEAREVLKAFFDAARLVEGARDRANINLDIFLEFFDDKEWFELPGLLAVPEPWKEMEKAFPAEPRPERLLRFQLLRIRSVSTAAHGPRRRAWPLEMISPVSPKERQELEALLSQL